jgi:hypothetical protein
MSTNRRGFTKESRASIVHPSSHLYTRYAGQVYSPQGPEIASQTCASTLSALQGVADCCSSVSQLH